MGDDLKCYCQRYQLTGPKDRVIFAGQRHGLKICTGFSIDARIDVLEAELKEVKRGLHDLRNLVMPLIIGQENDGK